MSSLPILFDTKVVDEGRAAGVDGEVEHVYDADMWAMFDNVQIEENKLMMDLLLNRCYPPAYIYTIVFSPFANWWVV